MYLLSQYYHDEMIPHLAVIHLVSTIIQKNLTRSLHVYYVQGWSVDSKIYLKILHPILYALGPLTPLF